MSVISWEEPPRHGTTVNWVAIVTELRQNPGRWAHAATYKSTAIASQIAAQLRRGQLVAARPPGSIEATAQKVDDEYRVYARYVGEEVLSRG